MDGKFLDIFTDIKIEDRMSTLVENSTISKVVTNRAGDKVRVYMEFPVIVPKQRIWDLERVLQKQYFDREGKKLEIVESFLLSDIYTPASAFSAYYDSFLDEIREKSNVLFTVIKKADISFDGDHMKLILEDTGVARQRTDDILAVINAIYKIRFMQDITIDVSYKKPTGSKYMEASDDKIKKAIDKIIDNIETNEQNAQNAVTQNSNGDKKSKSDKDKTEVRPLTRSTNPMMIYGRDFDGNKVLPIEEIFDGIGEVVLRGQVLSVDFKHTKTGKVIVSFGLTDFTDSVMCKLFLDGELEGEIASALKKGMFIKLMGEPEDDKFIHELCVGHLKGIMSIPDFRTKRIDAAAKKRVEIHAHTKMSDMDGVIEIADLIKRADEWGHKAIGICDHAVTQAFPIAAHSIPKGSDIKLIYGVETYLVDDTKQIVTDALPGQTIDDDFVVFDLETTGLNERKCRIIEIGAVRVNGGKIVDRFSEFVNPGVPIPFEITELTSITDNMVRDAESIETLLPKFHEFCRGAIMVAHNADFDTGVIYSNCERLSENWKFTYMDTMPMARFLLPKLKKFGLDPVAKALDLVNEHHHRAVDDAEVTAKIFLKFHDMLKDRGINTLIELNEAGVMNAERIRAARPSNCTIIAKNDLGKVNMYRLVSEAHLNYLSPKNRRGICIPKLPKSLLEKWREGLLIGSAGSEGELYDAIKLGKSDEEIIRIAKFYDFFEITPDAINSHLLGDRKYAIDTVEDLRDITKRIVSLGKELDKPVVATADVHFLDPKDGLYRQIIQSDLKMQDPDWNEPEYFRTTDEMLLDFAYLGEETAEEVVIKNSNMIADMCDVIKPTRPDKAPPVIENSDETLRKICYNKAHEVYGDPLPPVVEERLERELHSIISNGYAVMYIIAQKLVWKSNEDGYLVGSRGSVGSSFAATMAGITEVNPLPPHYICPSCHYVDFDSEIPKSFAGSAGCDMPDAVCPNCGSKLKKDGFDIPFETFLGFKGDKEPDIDLNFSGDYQTKAHRYCEVIFGNGQTFKAGTVGTVQDKTAFGFVKRYFERENISKRNCEIDRIVPGCTGIHRTTGQHPGGVVVLPMGEDIYSFTPLQHPANDMEKNGDIITTHYEYHSIDANLLKLDILGHADPTMIKSLEDMSREMGEPIDATTIPLDDKKVMSLFQDTSALGVEPEDLWNCEMGTLGIPEFGTDFAMGMLRDAKPKAFIDLVRIAGLAHGTDVWLGNAQTLIEEGKATISTAICTRDDIMTYLINMGLDPAESFNIMEAVRKGKVAKGGVEKWPAWKEDMLSHGVPDWYVWSCEKIKYMFPKAHAAAYVMMAWRVAWFKIYKPLIYYASFFSIRATAFDYEKMCQGQVTCEHYLHEMDEQIAELKKQNKDITATDKDLQRDLRLVQEMYARGFEFLPMDLYKSDARYFKIIDGKLLPPFNTLASMGDSAAETLMLAARQRPFSSKDDLKKRGKVTQTAIDKMEELGLLGDMQQSEQMSIFDL